MLRFNHRVANGFLALRVELFDDHLNRLSHLRQQHFF